MDQDDDGPLEVVATLEAYRQMYGFMMGCLVGALRPRLPPASVRATLRQWLELHRGDHRALPLDGAALLQLSPAQLKRLELAYRAEMDRMYAEVRALLDAQETDGS